ncbi:MAG: hypothetical protein WA133_02995, partial [Syntrophales bacterium]
MPSGKVNTKAAPVGLHQVFDEQEQAIINYLVHMTSPVSIDTPTALIKSAADALYACGDREKAVTYYDHILESFEKKPPTNGNVAVFLDTVLKKVHLAGLLPPHGEEVSLLIKAAKTANHYQKWHFLARIEFEIIGALVNAGQLAGAFKCFKDFEMLATKTGDPNMLKMVAFSMAHPSFHKSGFSRIIHCYEEAIGGQEEFENYEGALRRGTLVGWCYVVSGRIARGIGMIDTIRTKASLLNLHNIVICADVMSVFVLLEMRKVFEAEALLGRISLPSGNKMFDHWTLWAILISRAYILQTRKDYEGATECHKKALEHRRFIGWTHMSFSWSLECLCALDGQSADAEINNMITGDNIYTKGFAYRYRALRNTEKELPPTGILADLRKSEKYLKTAGAEIELARTRIALGNYHLKKGETKVAQSYLAKAWSFFSKV